MLPPWHLCCTNAVLAGTHGALLAKCSVLYLAGGCDDNMREAVAGSHEQQSVCKTATGIWSDACQLIGGRSAVSEGHQIASLEYQKRGLPNYSERGIVCIKGVNIVLKRYNITLSEDTAKWVQEYADRRDISFSAAVRCIVSDAEAMGLISVQKPKDDESEE